MDILFYFVISSLALSILIVGKGLWRLFKVIEKGMVYRWHVDRSSYQIAQSLYTYIESDSVATLGSDRQEDIHEQMWFVIIISVLTKDEKRIKILKNDVGFAKLSISRAQDRLLDRLSKYPPCKSDDMELLNKKIVARMLQAKVSIIMPILQEMGTEP